MAALGQTTYYQILENPSGYRYIQQCGRCAFVKKAKTYTMTTPFRRLVTANLTPCQATVAGKTAASIRCTIPYVSATQFTQVLAARKVIVSRATGIVSAVAFSYAFVGY